MKMILIMIMISQCFLAISQRGQNFGDYGNDDDDDDDYDDDDNDITEDGW